MADITSNYKLNKPLRNENVNIDVLNQNMDIIDANLKSLSDKTNTAVQSVKIGTTEYKSGTTVTLPNYPTTLPASDVSSWAKQNTKPTYTASEVGALPNTTTLSDFGVTASIDEINYVDGVTSNIQTQLDSKSESSHTHDDRYYTESEIDTKISNVDNTSDIDKPVSTAQQSAIDSAYANSNAYTDQKIADLINGAPTTLDTLGEIAAAMQEHEDVVSALNDVIGVKANQSELDTHTGNSIIHVTASERTNWNTAKAHADSVHAPSNAQENVIETIKVNGTALTPSSKVVNVAVPTKVSELTNDKNYLTSNDIDVSKEHTHANKTVLDKVTQDYLDKIDGIAEGAEVNVQSDWNAVSGDAFIKNKPEFATVATSGSYNDLINKPTIPSVGNGTITIKQAGATKGTFTTNQSGDTTIELTDNNTTYSVATQTADGLESAADKKKLDGIAIGAEVNQNAFSNVVIDSTTISADSKTDSLTLVAGSNVTITADADNDKITIASQDTIYTHPTTSGNKHIPSGGSSGQILEWSSSGTAKWVTPEFSSGGTTVYYQSTEPTVTNTTVWIN